MKMLLSIAVQVDVEPLNLANDAKAPQSVFESFVHTRDLIGSLISVEERAMETWIAGKHAEAEAFVYKKYDNDRVNVGTSFSHSLVIIT